MRLFEICTLIFIGLSLMNFFLAKKERVTWQLPSVTLLFCLLSVVIEGYRMQMLPAYIFAGVVMGMYFLPAAKKAFNKSKKLKYTWMVVMVVLLIVSLLPPLCIPVFTMPKPTGSYAIGTTLLHFIDTSRLETLTDEPSDYRELSVQVWYPAETVDGQKPVKYYPNKELAGTLQHIIPMPFGHNYLTLIDTHSYQDAPISRQEDKYPVILFSHGYTGNTRQNTIQMEELASHGYIVFSIGHTYEAVSVEFPHNQIIPLSKKHTDLFYGELSSFMDKEIIDKHGEAFGFRSLLDNGIISHERIDIWTNDTLFITNELEKLNRGDIKNMFQHKLDMDRLGIFGHSFGGATAGKTLVMDKRFKAGINMDGGQFGDIREHVISQPFMLMHTPFSSETLLVGYHPDQPMYNVRIVGTQHYSFTDISIHSPIYKWMGILGDTNGYHMQTIMNDCILSFFNKHLKGEHAPLLENHNPYEEVHIEYR
ncbi:isoform II [Vallitalea pronyensis]|uniref:Isoform II n=1 Tax=Vallitalea pronyensis TaxID=1348613 RepID=A0A8J8MPD4_9FIRM|nr:isoform II [Vallitalea pronyensis]QUI25179.1 isoform II [Vallitalea pronyensis]